jgi:hypothetical protein
LWHCHVAADIKMAHTTEQCVFKTGAILRKALGGMWCLWWQYYEAKLICFHTDFKGNELFLIASLPKQVTGNCLFYIFML